MLVHLSELLGHDPVGVIPRLPTILNQTFTSVSSSITGSLALAPVEEFDLMMTNPPYVTRGTGRHRDFLRENPKTADYYDVKGERHPEPVHTVDCQGIEAQRTRADRGGG